MHIIKPTTIIIIIIIIIMMMMILGKTIIKTIKNPSIKLL